MKLSVVLLFALIGMVQAQTATPLGRGINLGNALEAPHEGDWGLRIEAGYFKLIADAGFDTVRLPIKWSAHASQDAPYALNAAFLARVDELLAQALAQNLNVILDFHHFDQMASAPESHAARWLGIWRQLAEHYKDAPARVYFELLNEPNSALTDTLWNAYLARAITVIRDSNPTRKLIVGPTGWNAPANLPALELPDDDNLIVTVHLYEPFAFTHQGAEWVNPPPPVGVTWDGAQLGLASGWQDWSWETDVRLVEGSLELTYAAGWAGFYLHPEGDAGEVNELALTTDRAMRLQILCGPEDSEAAQLETVANREAVVSLAACGGTDGIARIIVQNGTDAPQPAFRVKTLELRGGAETVPLFSSEAANLRKTLETAATWAEAEGVPLFVGEFGAYEKADMASRVRWTRTVRESAEAVGAGWAYWEFGAGFGVYDVAAKAWRQELLGALIGGE